ncbi:MAG: NAD(P)-dependent oxidoreductase [Ferruginibacter sp.]|nr:NAD(P)-dependent oxidoreductase [Ferruginibacter sp.]
MKKVLVTGATGFVGKPIVDDLVNRGYQVIIASRNIVQATTPNVVVKPFDLNFLDHKTDYFKYFNYPDVCIHLAWIGLPNYLDEIHLKQLPQHERFLENLLSNGLQELTVTGTCFEYGLIEGELKEDMVSFPVTAYGKGKYALTKWLINRQNERAANVKSLRLFYMWGEGQSPKSLIPMLNAAIERGDSSFPMSGGEQVRDFLPVEEMARRIVILALNPAATGIINCCSGKPITLKGFVKQYLSRKNASISLHFGVYPYLDYEPMAFWGSVKKLNSFLKEN